MSKIFMSVAVSLTIILNVSCGETKVSPESVKIGEIQKFGEKFLNKNIEYRGYISNIYACNHNDGYTCLDIFDGVKGDSILIKTDKVDIKLFNESLEDKTTLIFIGNVKKMGAAKGLGGETVSLPALVVNEFKRVEAVAANAGGVDSKNSNSGKNTKRNMDGDWERVEGADYKYDRGGLKKINGNISFSIAWLFKKPSPISGSEKFANGVVADLKLQCNKSIINGVWYSFSESQYYGNVSVLESTELDEIDFSKLHRQLGLETFTLEGLGRQVEGAMKDGELDSDIKFLQPILAIVVPLCDGK